MNQQPFLDALLGEGSEHIHKQLHKYDRNNPQESEKVREAVLKKIKPKLIDYLVKLVNHEPKSLDGDLLRWDVYRVDGKLWKVPSVRRDLVKKAAEGKIEVDGGMDLIDFILSKISPVVVTSFVIVTRLQNLKNKNKPGHN